MKHFSTVRARQRLLAGQYFAQPDTAQVTDVAVIEGTHLDDPFHTEVALNDTPQTTLAVGVNEAVGGYHDAPSPGDLLCAALAASFESSLRMTADRLGFELSATSVKVEADLDVRGALRMDSSVPVGYQRLRLFAKFGLHSGTRDRINQLLEASKQYCIIYQTLRQSIPIEVDIEITNALRAVA